jgi:hypothetical protein
MELLKCVDLVLSARAILLVLEVVNAILLTVTSLVAL